MNAHVLSDEIIQAAEKFFIILYGGRGFNDIDKLRAHLFDKAVSLENLPPTKDALLQHIKRAHYQAAVWRQAYLSECDIPEPENMIWCSKDDEIKPILMTLKPVPFSCIQLASCTCKTNCNSKKCSCKKSDLPCTSACACKD